MEFGHYDDNQNMSLTRFESMLKTNNVLFFDSNEFENIIHHYLENGKIALAKKAIKLGLEQHPTSLNLKLFQVEVYIFENKLDAAEAMLEDLNTVEPFNEEIYIQRATVLSKKDKHEDAIGVFLSALDFAQEKAELYAFVGMEYLYLNEYENAKTYFMKCLEEDYEDYASLYNVIYCFEYLDQPQQC